MEGKSDIILMGDFNHGPAIPGLEADAPQVYELMVSTGLFSATVEKFGQCTYCKDNVLIGNERANLILDHIYLSINRAPAVVRVEVSLWKNCVIPMYIY